MKGQWTAGEKGNWCAIDLRSDADLVAGKPQPWKASDDSENPTCEQIFRGFREVLAPYAETPAEPPAVTAPDFPAYNAPNRLATERDHFFAIQSRDEQWVGLQFQFETIVFRPGVLRALELMMWHPAKSGGGFDIQGTLSSGQEAKTFTIRVDYHPSEAGAFRLLRVLLTLGELFGIPVRLREGMDV